MNYTDNDTYKRIHFAIMAIESGARKLGISGKALPKKHFITTQKSEITTQKGTE